MESVAVSPERGAQSSTVARRRQVERGPGWMLRMCSFFVGNKFILSGTDCLNNGGKAPMWDKPIPE